MNGKCIDIGMIQAFLDGELGTDASLKVSHHIAACDDCAGELARAEEESAVVFPILEREFNTLVPTQRLWTKINDSIAVEKEQRPFWKKLWAGAAFNMFSPSLAGAASLVIVLGVVAAVWNFRTNESVAVAPAPVAVNRQAPVITPTTPDRFSTDVESTNVRPEPAAKYVASRNEQRVTAVHADYREPVTPKAARNDTAAAAEPTGYMPGEESYVKTISNLSQSISAQKDSIMRPAERISYERDMAVVNDSIKRMREEVRKDPKNESAKQVLYSSYQNKIDLLNSVSQKEELMASLR